jgi:hypothetical protein
LLQLTTMSPAAIVLQCSISKDALVMAIGEFGGAPALPGDGGVLF